MVVKQVLLFFFLENKMYEAYVVVVIRKSLLVRAVNVRVTRSYVTLWRHWRELREVKFRMTFSVAEISLMQV